MRVVELFKNSIVQYSYLVEVENRLKLVRDCDNSMFCKSPPQDALNKLICSIVDALFSRQRVLLA